jgi:hypothetical protein
MHNLSSKKAQFFILTTVVIVGVFYTLSRYINQYAFVDTSRSAVGSEGFFLDNAKDKAIKTVEISAPTELSQNLGTYKNFVERMASDKGYNFVFNYVVGLNEVNVTMVLVSEKMTLKSSFIVLRP